MRGSIHDEEVVADMSYTLLDITTADIAFKAIGKDLNELFESAAHALTDLMVKGEVKEGVDVQVGLREEETEVLLQRFLSEVLYYFDGEQLVFKTIKVQTDGKGLTAMMKGEKFDHKRHKIEMDVKAVTHHKLEVKKTSKGYECTVVLDI